MSESKWRIGLGLKNKHTDHACIHFHGQVRASQSGKISAQDRISRINLETAFFYFFLAMQWLQSRLTNIASQWHFLTLLGLSNET